MGRTYKLSENTSVTLSGRVLIGLLTLVVGATIWATTMSLTQYQMKSDIAEIKLALGRNNNLTK